MWHCSGPRALRGWPTPNRPRGVGAPCRRHHEGGAARWPGRRRLDAAPRALVESMIAGADIPAVSGARSGGATSRWRNKSGFFPGVRRTVARHPFTRSKLARSKCAPQRCSTSPSSTARSRDRPDRCRRRRVAFGATRFAMVTSGRPPHRRGPGGADIGQVVGIAGLPRRFRRGAAAHRAALADSGIVVDAEPTGGAVLRAGGNELEKKRPDPASAPADLAEEAGDRAPARAGARRSRPRRSRRARRRRSRSRSSFGVRVGVASPGAYMWLRFRSAPVANTRTTCTMMNATK